MEISRMGRGQRRTIIFMEGRSRLAVVRKHTKGCLLTLHTGEQPFTNMLGSPTQHKYFETMKKAEAFAINHLSAHAPS